jgi:hypothetical protein
MRWCTNPITVPRHLTAGASLRGRLQIRLDFSTPEAARLVEVPRGAWDVIVQSCKKLDPARPAKAVIETGQHVAVIRVDSGDEVSNVLQVVGLDLGTSTHHECACDNEAVVVFVASLLGTKLGQELVTQARVQLLTRLRYEVAKKQFVFA